jgi:ParB-like chromosome segregation protein Spo0J
MEIKTWAVERVIPYHRNARKISDRAVAKVAKSLKEFGWQQPLVVTPKGELIVGHCRLKAAIKNGWNEVPVYIAANLTPSQVRAYRLMDNRSHDETEWDFEALGIEVADH